MLHINSNQKRTVVALLVLLNNMDVKSKSVAKSKEGCQILIKMSVHHRDIALTNIYSPAIRKPKSRANVD